MEFELKLKGPFCVEISSNEACCQVRNEGIGYDALFSRHGGVAECRWNFPRIREVYSRDPEEVRDDGLQSHDHTYSIESESIE